MKYYYFGIHKAASTWLIQILYDINDFMNKKHAHYHSAKMFDHDINKVVYEKKLDFVSYTNSEYNTVQKINHPFKAFHVIRDPRDIVASSYFSHLNTHSDNMWPELNDYRKELKSLDKEEGIIATMNHLENMRIDGEPVLVFDCLKNWNYDNPSILELKFEDITKYPYILIPEIFEFMGLLDSDSKQKSRNNFSESFLKFKKGTIDIKSLLYFIYKHDFYFKSGGRKKGEISIDSHYRKGESGDWKNHFSPRHVSYFKERYGDMLIKLGYEKDNNW